MFSNAFSLDVFYSIICMKHLTLRTLKTLLKENLKITGSTIAGTTSRFKVICLFIDENFAFGLDNFVIF